jgi:WD40 repeat protein
LELEAKAERWARAGKPRNALLSGHELAHTRELLASPALKAFGISESVKEYVQASELAEGRRHRWRDRIVMAGVASVVGAVAWTLYVAKSHAEDATSIAQADVAKQFAKQQGLEFGAVAYGMRAVHPRLDERRGPPAEAVEGLRVALAAVGHDTWLRGFSGQVTDVGISADGKRAVARTTDALCAWDTATGKPLFECLKITKESSQPDFFFSPDRKWMYRLGRAGTDDTAQMWNARTGERVFESQLTGIREIGFSRDGAWAVAFGPKTNLLVVDLATEKISASFQRPVADLSSVVIAPKGNLMAPISVNGDVQLWNRNTGKALASPLVKGDDATYNHVIFSPDAQRIAVTSVDLSTNKARSTVWSITDDHPTGRSAEIELDLPPLSQFDLEFSPDGNTVTTLTTYSATVWNAVSGARIGELVLPDGASAQLLDDARIIVSKGEGDHTTLAVFDPPSDKPLAQRVIPGEVISAGVAGDFTRFVSAGKNRSARVYKATEAPMKLDQLSAKDLFAMACEKIRYQQEFSSLDLKIKEKCKGMEQ